MNLYTKTHTHKIDKNEKKTEKKSMENLEMNIDDAKCQLNIVQFKIKSRIFKATFDGRKLFRHFNRLQ